MTFFKYPIHHTTKIQRLPKKKLCKNVQDLYGDNYKMFLMDSEY